MKDLPISLHRNLLLCQRGNLFPQHHVLSNFELALLNHVTIEHSRQPIKMKTLQKMLAVSYTLMANWNDFGQAVDEMVRNLRDNDVFDGSADDMQVITRKCLDASQPLTETNAQEQDPALTSWECDRCDLQSTDSIARILHCPKCQVFMCGKSADVSVLPSAVASAFGTTGM